MNTNRWRLDGQTALITGASAGIGLAIARELLGFGADLLLVARDADALAQARDDLADEFPGRAIHGRIDSFAPATGSEFALIPVENATGNFTKITQRVPVRIVIDDAGAALRPGLSVEVKVDLKSDAAGPSFAEAADGETRLAEVTPAPSAPNPGRARS